MERLHDRLDSPRGHDPERSGELACVFAGFLSNVAVFFPVVLSESDLAPSRGLGRETWQIPRSFHCQCWWTSTPRDGTSLIQREGAWYVAGGVHPRRAKNKCGQSCRRPPSLSSWSLENLIWRSDTIDVYGKGKGCCFGIHPIRTDD